jgi:hypothetical protein
VGSVMLFPLVDHERQAASYEALDSLANDPIRRGASMIGEQMYVETRLGSGESSRRRDDEGAMQSASCPT